MGVYSGNRTSLGELDPIEYMYDESVTCDDALLMIGEAFENEQRMFDAVITSDIMEALAYRSGDAIQEGVAFDNVKSKATSIWEKVVKFAEDVRTKILSIIDSFLSKIEGFRKNQISKYVSANKTKFNNVYASLTNTKVLNCPVYTATPSLSVADAFGKIVGACEGSTKIPKLVDNNTDGRYDEDKNIRDYKYDDALDNVDNHIFKSILDTSECANAKDFKTMFKAKIYMGGNRHTDTPFAVVSKDTILTILSAGYDGSKFRKAKSDIHNYFTGIKKTAKKALIQAKKADKSDSKKNDIARANAYYKLVASEQRAAGIVISSYITEEKNKVKWALMLFKKAVSKATDKDGKTKKTNESFDYEFENDLVTEDAMLECELALDLI